MADEDRRSLLDPAWIAARAQEQGRRPKISAQVQGVCEALWIRTAVPVESISDQGMLAAIERRCRCAALAHGPCERSGLWFLRHRPGT